MTLIAVVAVCAVWMIGCLAAPGSKYAAGLDRVGVDGGPPNTLTGVDREGTGAVAAVGPVSQTEISVYGDAGQPQESIRSRAGSSASHRAVIPLPGTTRSIVADTQANTKARIGKLFDPSTGHLIMEDLSLDVDAAAPVRAANEALDRLAPVYIEMYQTHRAEFLAQMDAVKAVSPDLFSFLTAALRAAGVPIP
ncbi:MAG: hypothetical protein WAZ94_13375 [Phycisphaerales bacterium]